MGGGSVTTRRLASVDGRSWAIFSVFKAHRYALGRDWSGAFDTEPRILFSIGLNPSLAGIDDDQTIRKDVGFAKRLLCTRLVKVNLYGWILTASTDLEGIPARSVVGEQNDEAIAAEVAKLNPDRTLFLAAWGSHPMATHERIAAVRALLTGPLHCLGTTADGSPRHTSRIAYSTPLEGWSPP
jgi:hypothetical protein